jgi:predicted dehydrogenase
MGDVMVRAIDASMLGQVAVVSDADHDKAVSYAKRWGCVAVPIHLLDAECLDSNEVDAVAVATPPTTHAELSIAALRAGRSVLCEKPMAMNTSEARLMSEEASRAGTIAVVDHQLRFNPARVQLRQLLRDGYVGRPLHVVSLAYFPKLASQPWTWWHRRELGGGLLNEYGSHTVDLLRWLLGEVTDAHGTLATVSGTSRATVDGEVKQVNSDDVAQIHLTFDSGATADLIMSAAPSFSDRRLEIHGTDGSLVLGPDDVISGRRRGADEESFVVPERAPSLIGWNDDTFTQPFGRLLEEFIHSVSVGVAPTVASTFGDGWRTIEVLDKVRVSTQEETYQ